MKKILSLSILFAFLALKAESGPVVIWGPGNSAKVLAPQICFPNSSCFTSSSVIPSQTSQAGNYLGTNGTTLSWQAASGGAPSGSAGGDLGGTYPNPTVTSISDITTGILGLTHGGTGQTTAVNALGALLPTQTSNSGKVLQTNGTVATWQTPSGGSSPASPSGSLQYNNSSSLGASALTTPDSGISFAHSEGLFGWGMFVNLVTQSENIQHGSNWVLNGGSGSSINGGEFDPMGTSNAYHIFSIGNQAGPQNIAVPIIDGQTYTVSIWLKSGSGTPTLHVGFNDVQTPFTVSTSWKRYSAQLTATASSSGFVIWGLQNGSNTQFYAWGPQLSTALYSGGGDGPYMPTGDQGISVPLTGLGGASIYYGNIYAPIFGSPAVNLIAENTAGANPYTTFGGRILWDTSSGFLKVSTGTGTTYKTLAFSGGGSGSITGKGTGSLSGGSASISDASIVPTSIVDIVITSMNGGGGTYQITPSSGSASVQSYYVNFGSSQTNGSDNSSFSYYVIN